MPLQATSGAASYDAFGGGAPAAAPTYIEDVFSTWLYTGNNSTNNIVNGIDLSTKGGMVWCKARSAVNSNTIWDSVRGVKNFLITNATSANVNLTSSFPTYGLQSFNTNGFTLGVNYEGENDTGDSIASWTFRKQPKFFDVVTYTGTGSNRTIAHSLGSVPACIMVKRTDTTGDWQVYHRSLANTEYLVLNSSAAKATGATRWNSTTPTSSVFSLGTDASVNASAGTYVAYIFAHDAGGFGLTGTDNVISCGSYTGNGSTSGPTINLGYEPQWLLVKNATTIGNWFLMDNMRGIPMTGDTAILKANTSAAEDNNQGHAIELNGTGFQVTTSFTGTNGSGDTLIYIAIRRGPMKVPTTGTSVFAPNIGNNVSGSGLIANAGFPVDAHFEAFKDTTGRFWFDRLRGDYNYLSTASTAAETAAGQRQFANMSGAFFSGTFNFSSAVVYDFRRAPSFFDEVCYTGTGSTTTITHNLGLTPELVITKSRTNGSLGWVVWTTSLTSTNYWIRLDDTMAQANSPVGYGGTFSASNYTIANTGPYNALNGSGQTYVAYLFATCAGVSKVGSYTGTGTTLQINCGFTAGARFVLIKRTDSTGDWYVWDTARGIIAGNDPYLLLNSTAAEVTSTDYIDTYSAGFEISNTAPAAINANGGTYIFLAIA